ncbi:MAG: type VI secretion system baseplate subunit TssG [Planctomycetota bacterium]
MAGTNGTATPGLSAPMFRMGSEPYRFDFYHAMRVLESVHSDRPRFGKSLRLSEEAIRFSQIPSLKFAPTTIAEFASMDGGLQKLGIYFFGLCGPNGALPLHLTEYVRDRIRHNDDHTLAAFLDIFHHRMIALFYRAWADAQPTVHRDRPTNDRFAMYIGSLIGLGMESMRDRDEVPDLAKLFYAPQLSNQVRHPEGLESILADFFRLPVRIDEFVGDWIELPRDCQFRLGESPQSATLGVGCTIGSHVWDCQQKFRITIGPIGWDDFVRLLPGTENEKRLHSLVKNYVGDELLWDVNLVLKQSETPSMQLGNQRLGETAWIDREQVHQDARDLIIERYSDVA